MGTFSDLPRYPPDSVDEPDGPPATDGAVSGAIAIAQTAGEVLFFAAPIFACLWYVVCLPILLALILATVARDERR